jgi:hypothetical protein
MDVVGTDVEEERICYIISVTRFGYLGALLATTSSRSTLHCFKLCLYYTACLLLALREGMSSHPETFYNIIIVLARLTLKSSLYRVYP